MVLDNGGVEGTFLEESKSRFLCSVRVDDEIEECYVPSSCKLGKLIDLSGKKVLLQSVDNKNARTKYSVEAIKFSKGYVLLNLSEVNRIIHENINRKLFSFLGTRKRVKREVRVDGYKADLYVEDSGTIVEIKTLLSPEKSALFPSVTSKRAEQQLKKILGLLETYKVCYIIVSLHPKTKTIALNSSMSRYEELFRQCLSKGMECRVYSLSMNERKEPVIKRNVYLDLNEDIITE